MKVEADVVVIGGGHAGAEAAWAASRLGAKTVLVTLEEKRIGQMSCNPAIGGLAKGQMVREIDALGGLMGLAIDATGIQFRMLNRSKGPAVWGPRAQADKWKYAKEVQRLLRTCENLTIVEGEVADLVTEELPGGAKKIVGVKLASGVEYACGAAVVTTGTFLRALMHTGEAKTEGGRIGEMAAKTLSGCLARLGLELGRLKTGTPPRLHRDSIDYGQFTVQPGDEEPIPFSYLNEYPDLNGKEEGGEKTGEQTGEKRGGRFVPPLPQIPMYLGNTNEKVHELIRANIHRAPMFSGQIESTGPRYCPSIEDKVVRFSEKGSHHIFLEPEGLDTEELYVNGISTSLPADVQEGMIRAIPGLEKAVILKFGYAVEYDMVWPSQIDSTLETKKVRGLFLAGQINGTSGYEEAGGQGQMAGINAARRAAGSGGEGGLVLKRDEAYIGVLIDDLVTKPPTEPYRMFTSRAEHRLHLRNDNADMRLTAIGRKIGLVDDERWARFEATRTATETLLALLGEIKINWKGGVVRGDEFLRRENHTFADLKEVCEAVRGVPGHVAFRAEVAVKYAGYLQRQQREVERLGHMEEKLIPQQIDYKAVPGLRNEARQKLMMFTPRSLGQALRISGITPADVTLLAVHLTKN